MASQALMGQSSPSFDAKKIFPTPNFLDLIVLEVVSRKLEDYVELAYGTFHPLPAFSATHRLVFQVEQSEELVIRYYAADRPDQDAYNYNISYSAESNAHPIYPRDYIVRRSQYAVIAKLTADPMFAAALLVKEDMVEDTGDPRIDSLYVRVRRIYETLPGPELIRKGYDVPTGAKTRIVKQRVVTATAVTVLGTSRVFDGVTMYAQDSYFEPDTSVVGTLVTVYQVLPTAVLTVYDQDEKTQVNVATSYQVVAMPVSAPSQTQGILITYQKIDSQKALKITRDFTEFLNFTYEEQRFAADSFPDLWDYTQFFWTNGCGAFSEERSAFSAHAQTRTEVTFDTSAQVIAGLVIKPQTLKLGHAVNLTNILVDAGSIIYAEPDCAATTSFAASDPSYTDYVDNIQNTEQLIAGESVLWRAGLWMTTKVYEIML